MIDNKREGIDENGLLFRRSVVNRIRFEDAAQAKNSPDYRDSQSAKQDRRCQSANLGRWSLAAGRWPLAALDVSVVFAGSSPKTNSSFVQCVAI